MRVGFCWESVTETEPWLDIDVGGRKITKMDHREIK
jgi:hypothetical protein